MTCKEYEEILMDLESRGGRTSWMSGASVLDLAKQHADNCVACAVKMSEISRIGAALDQLRLSALRIEVPATIESNLLEEFRRRKALRATCVPRTVPWRLVWGSAAALALVAGLVAYASLRATPSVTAQAARTEHHGAQQPPLRSDASSHQGPIENHHPDADRPGVVSANTGRAIKRRHSAKQVAREFVSSADNELSLNGGGNVVRVTLPVASLIAMGVPMYPEFSDRRVTADVARDPFGAVIAIRLVETRSSTN